MKILEIIPFLDSGGAQVMCATLSKKLHDKRHEVVVVSLYAGEWFLKNDLISYGIKVIELHKKPGIDFSIIRALKKIIKTEKPDIIHTHLFASKYACLSTRRIPVVHTIHSVASKENTKIGILINKYYVKRKKMILVSLSNEVQKTVIKVYKIKKEESPIILNGIELKCCCDTIKKHEGNVIINVGRLSDVKNQIALIKAFDFVVEKISNCRLWLIGDGELREDIENCISKSAHKDLITLWGNQDNPSDFLYKSTLFVLPSKYEGIPLSLAEAMAVGLPIIASDVGGIKDMIKNGYNGILINPDVDSIANSIIKVLNDKKLYNLLAENAKKTAVSYSANEMCKNYENLFMQIVKER